MAEVRSCCPWAGGAAWPLFIFLASLPCALHCSDAPGVVAEKVFPRGSHWAVGHLMGKKSAESLLRGLRRDAGRLAGPDTAGVTEPDWHESAIEALMQQEAEKRRSRTADRLPRLRSLWREGTRYKYLREMSDLLLLALEMQRDHST